MVKSGQFATYNDYHARDDDLLIFWSLYFFSNHPRHFGRSSEIWTGLGADSVRGGGGGLLGNHRGWVLVDDAVANAPDDDEDDNADDDCNGDEDKQTTWQP